MNSELKTRVCKICNDEFTIDEFAKSTECIGKHAFQCKECVNKRSRDRRHKYIERGLCPCGAGRPLLAGRKWCSVCLEKSRKYYRDKKRAPRLSSRKSEDRVGQTYGKLFVLSIKSRNPVYFLCQCACGKKIPIRGCNLGRSANSCGCLRKEPRKNWRPHYKPYVHGIMPKKVWTKVMSNARKRGIEFSITQDEAMEKLQNQEFKCALTGMPITLPKSSSDPERYTASMDRVNSELSYTKGNVQWVHKDINILKRDFKEPYFIELCGKVANHARDIRAGSEIVLRTN